MRQETDTQSARGGGGARILAACGIFVVTLGLFTIGYYREPTTRWLLGMTEALASSSSAVLSIMGVPSEVRFSPAQPGKLPAYVLRGKDAALEIAVDCNGAWAFAIFLATVLAVPSTGRAKAWGIGLGFPSLWVINVLRIVSLYFVAVHFPAAFEAIHLYVWQFLIIGLALVLLAAWTQWFVVAADA